MRGVHRYMAGSILGFVALLLLIGVIVPAFAMSIEQAAATAVAAMHRSDGAAFLDRTPVNCPEGADGVIRVYADDSPDMVRGCWKLVQDYVVIIFDDGDVGRAHKSQFKWLPSA